MIKSKDLQNRQVNGHGAEPSPPALLPGPLEIIEPRPHGLAGVIVMLEDMRPPKGSCCGHCWGVARNHIVEILRAL
jgi:hypothetical protein